MTFLLSFTFAAVVVVVADNFRLFVVNIVGVGEKRVIISLRKENLT